MTEEERHNEIIEMIHGLGTLADRLHIENGILLKAVKNIQAVGIDSDMYPAQQRSWMRHFAEEALKETDNA